MKAVKKAKVVVDTNWVTKKNASAKLGKGSPSERLRSPVLSIEPSKKWLEVD